MCKCHLGTGLHMPLSPALEARASVKPHLSSMAIRLIMSNGGSDKDGKESGVRGAEQLDSEVHISNYMLA